MSRRLPSRLAALVVLCAPATAAFAQTTARAQGSETYFVGCGVFKYAEDAQGRLDNMKDYKVKANIARSAANNGMPVFRVDVGPYKMRDAAQHALEALQAQNAPCEVVFVMNDQKVAAAVARQKEYEKKQRDEATRRAAAARSGDGAYGLDYQQQQWESCVRSNGGYTGGNYNTGKADWKCGSMPSSK